MANSEKWHKFKPLPTDIQERLPQLTALFIEEKVYLAYLFGSLAQNAAAHDVDLALLLPTAQTTALSLPKRPFHLLPAITDILGTERIDIVDLRRASPALQFEIVRQGRCLFARDDDQQLQFETAVIRQYQDTAYWRRQQEQLLKARMQRWS